MGGSSDAILPNLTEVSKFLTSSYPCRLPSRTHRAKSETTACARPTPCPLVSRGRAFGCRTTRRPTRIAWRYWPEIELRTPGSFPALILDCDSEPEADIGYIGVLTHNPEAANARLDVPLYADEVHDIVKSVIKISRKNLASGQTQANFSFIQASRGRKSGVVRRKAALRKLLHGRVKVYRGHGGTGSGREGSRLEPKQMIGGMKTPLAAAWFSVFGRSRI